MVCVNRVPRAKLNPRRGVVLGVPVMVYIREVKQHMGVEGWFAICEEHGRHYAPDIACLMFTQNLRSRAESHGGLDG